MRILLAEDDPAQLEPLYNALADAGHIIDGARDGETAQWLLWQKHDDLPPLILERGELATQIPLREFQLLEYFLRHPYQALTRAQIEQALWKWGTEPETNAVTPLVRRLRQRLAIIAARAWIETIYGIGYRLNPSEVV